MTGDEKMLNNFIQEFREEFMKLLPEDIAYPRRTVMDLVRKGTTELWRKSAPIHVKGSLLYNHLVEKNKLGNKYVKIQEGDKIKFLHMRQPNLYQCSSFSFPVSVPRELDIINSIDYDMQYEKSFIEPLKFITEKINWLIDSSYGTQGTLEDFFV